MEEKPIRNDVRLALERAHQRFLEERKRQRNTDFLTPKEERWYREKLIEYALELHPEMIEYV